MPVDTLAPSVTGVIAEIERDHARYVCVNFPDPGICLSRCPGSWPCQAYRCAAALKAALAPHEVRAWYLAATDCDHPEPPEDSDARADWDGGHPPGTGDAGRICLHTQIASYCPACTELVYGDEEPYGDAYVPAPCRTRQDITRELLGKAATGA